MESLLIGKKEFLLIAVIGYLSVSTTTATSTESTTESTVDHVTDTTATTAAGTTTATSAAGTTTESSAAAQTTMKSTTEEPSIHCYTASCTTDGSSNCLSANVSRNSNCTTNGNCFVNVFKNSTSSIVTAGCTTDNCPTQVTIPAENVTACCSEAFCNDSEGLVKINNEAVVLQGRLWSTVACVSLLVTYMHV